MEKDGSSEKVILNNIANQDHVLSHYNDKQFDKLPQEDIFYTEGFIKDYLSPTYLGSQEKILKQIKNRNKGSICTQKWYSYLVNF